jgi:hypothetical protein
MPPPQRQQRTLSVKEKKLNDRVVKLARDAQRADGTSISDTDVSQWIAPPISWSYQNMIVIAITRFKDFIKLVGPDDCRGKSGAPRCPNRQCRFAAAPLLLDLANT